jgi:hypothetical protein
VDKRVSIRMDLKENGCKNVDWTALPQDRDNWQCLLNVLMNRKGP